MRTKLLDLLVWPGTDEPLRYEEASQPEEGRLVGPSGQWAPVHGGIPRFVPDEAYAESFGHQWNRFEVRQPEEDEATFQVKTGVYPKELNGKLVLDAGCGGGRYSHVAAEHGAYVVGVDRSSAVNKARDLCTGSGQVDLIQADLTGLPLRPASFDVVFSIGVLHHGPDPRSSFQAIAQMVKPGGRLSVWVYRRNTWPQEWINRLLRAIARKLPRPVLLACCQLGALAGAVPIVNQTLNKVIPFSNHPRWENRVCDTFDWYSPRYQSHHPLEEVVNWFETAGFEGITELPPARRGAWYQWALTAGLLVGSGVNVTGIRK